MRESAVKCTQAGGWGLAHLDVTVFAGSDRGGKTAAVLYTFIASCQRHGIDPFAYLRDVLAQISACPVNNLYRFLPDRWKLAPTSSRPMASSGLLGNDGRR